jgi:hypothetical protein
MKIDRLNGPQSKCGNIAAGLVCILALCFFGAFAVLSFFGYVSDSEIWSVNLGKNISTQWYQPWLYSRPLFYLPLGFVTAFSNNALGIFRCAKMLFFLNGAAIVLLTYLIAEQFARMGRRPFFLVPVFAVFLLLSSPLFLYQGYRIRSDLVGCSLQLLVLYIANKAEDGPACNAGALLLPILATPKSFLHSIGSAIYIRTRTDLRYGTPLLFFSILAIILVYPQAPAFFRGTLFQNESGAFFSLARFYHLKTAATGAPTFLLILLFRVPLLGFRLWKNLFLSQRERDFHLSLAALAVFSFISVVFFPEKTPFFIASNMPVLVIFGSMVIGDLPVVAESVPSLVRQAYLPISAWFVFGILCSTLAQSGATNFLIYFKHDRADKQFAAIETLEKYLDGYPGAIYFDGVGLIPSKNYVNRFVGPNDPETNKETLRWIAETEPDLIFYVDKLAAHLEPGLSKILERDYFQISQGVFARWFLLDESIDLSKKSAVGLALLRSRLHGARRSLGATNGEKFTILAKGLHDERLIMETDFGKLERDLAGGKAFSILKFSPYIGVAGIDLPMRSLISFDVGDWQEGADK